MLYDVKIDYFCQYVRTGGSWFTLECKEKPVIGAISKKNLLGSHGCGRDNYSQACEDDPDCCSEIVVDYKNFDLEVILRT